MKTQFLLLLPLVVMLFDACQPGGDSPVGDTLLTPPSVSQKEDHCCRRVLERFEEDQNTPLPDSVIACVREALDGLPDGYSETEARCRYALAYQESAKRNYEASNRLMFDGERLLSGRNNATKDSLLADMYNLISINFQLQSEYTRTLAYSEQAEALYRKLEAWEELVNELSNQAVCYYSVGDLRVALEKTRQAESLFSTRVHNPRKPLTRVNLENTRALLTIQEGDQYAVLGWPEKAMEHYAAALGEIDSLLVALDTLARQDPVYAWPFASTHFSRTALLSKMVDSLGTRPFLDQAQFLLEKLRGLPPGHPMVGYAYLMLAKANALMEQFSEAGSHLRIGLGRLGYSNEELMESPPVAMDIQAPQTFVLSGLQAKGEVLELHHQASGNREYLEAALNNYRQGIAYLDSIRILQVDDAAAEGVRRIANGFIANAIRVAYQLYELAPSEARLGQLFELAGQGKSYTVRQAVFRQLGFLQFEGEMQRLLWYEQDLRRKLLRYKQQGHSDSIILATRQYEAFIDSLQESSSPAGQAYYRERFSNQAITPEQARSMLDDTTAILSFVHGAGTGLCFVLTAGKAEVVPLPMEGGRIAEAAQALKDNLRSGSIGRFAENAHRLYQLAFSDALQRLPQNIRRLAIVPDGALHGLPFECLLVEAPDGKARAGHRYLLDEYWVTYTYSEGVFDYLKKLPEQEKTYEIGVFLSKYEQGEAAGNPLRCADQPLKEMARQSKRIFRSFKRKGHSAICRESVGEAAFKELAGQCRILHFAAHGCAETSQARDYAILLTLEEGSGEDGNLRSGEILSLNLQGSALAVLSLCDTHAGANQPGEGLASIARAFTLAGCPSLLASTFKARQAPTALITSAFYAQLLNGKPKDVALGLAKRAYLEQNPMAEPADWAPLILIGDGKALY